MEFTDSSSLHHLALGAADVALLGAFYRDILGLPEVDRHQYPDGGLRSIWLGLGGGAVLMVEERGGEGSGKGGEQGLFLLAFRVAPARRAEIEGRLQVDGRTEHTSYFRDPEGNRFALSEYPLPQ